MTIRNLAAAIRPRSVALIGASQKPGSVGNLMLANLRQGGFSGPIWAVNPKHDEIDGAPCYRSIAALPGAPDLAVIATPAPTVPGLVGELAQKGCRAAIVISAGFSNGNGLKQALYDAAEPTLFRIIGPNTLGLMIPPIGLNASFSHLAGKPGGIALLSQSGAIVTTLMDWAADRAIGFSHVVSLGDMADVDVADYLDILAGDPSTRAVVLYLESIPNPRKFISAARACARLKPVIAIKSGRHAAAAKAAATHTGAMSGADRVVDAALKRAGILRVRDLDEMFDAVEAIGRFGTLEQARAGIVTNGGGAGVLIVDALADHGMDAATLADGTIKALDGVLPAHWSRANPVDIIGDAPPERYRAAIEAVAADPGVDVVVVMNCPTALASPIDAAGMVALLAPNGRINDKPVLATWLGDHVAGKGRDILEAGGIATFETPGETAAALSYLADWTKAQTQLTRVATDRPAEDDAANNEIRAILAAVARDRRSLLSEVEAKRVLTAAGIAVPETIIAGTPQEAGTIAARMLADHAGVAVKLLSRTITHKSDVGGVVLGLTSAEAAADAARAITTRLAQKHPGLLPDGFTVQPMVKLPEAEELILGMSHDPQFGPVILFGSGGVSVEVTDDTAIGLPPLDSVLAGDLIDATRIGRLLKGYRDRKPADRAAILAALTRLSRLVESQPGIVGIDINPLLAGPTGIMALDARIEIDPARLAEPAPRRDLAIRPWPAALTRSLSVDGERWTIRPILPADIALYPDFLAQVTEADLAERFLTPRPELDDQRLKRLTQLDYDREMAFVALDPSGALSGIGRMSADPDRETADIAVLVRSDLQGRGLGRALVSTLVDHGRREGIGRLEARLTTTNTRMAAALTEQGFALEPDVARPEDRLKAVLALPAIER